MFDVGFWELLFIMTLALLVLGPEKLPGLVSGLGRMMGRARAVARGLKLQIEREMAMNAASTRNEPPGRPAASAGAGGDPAGSTAATGDEMAGKPEAKAHPETPPGTDAAPDAGEPTEDERRSGT